MGTAVHCLPEWQAPVWVLTGFACCYARKSRPCHAGFRKCTYTCCACYSLFFIIAKQFVQRVKRNSTLTELTPYALRELVKAVYVDAPDKSSGKRRQKVHIEYDLVGYIPVDELLKAEQA